MNENVSIFIAFGAGLLAFFSPCVLPLIPSWLGIIGGSPMSCTGEDRPKPVTRTVSFILGFSVIFIVLSIIFAATFNFMGAFFKYINIIAGLIVIFLGLNILFNFISFLNFEKRFNLKYKPKGIIGAFFAGLAFGAGWTPCIGPVLTGILVLAGQSGGIPSAILYLSFFSFGLGLPFFLASLCYNAFINFSAKLRSHLCLIQRISGVLLIVLGILITTGIYQSISAFVSAPVARGQSSTDTAINDIDRTISKEVTAAFINVRIPALREGIDISDFKLPLLDGTEISLSGLKGKVVFLNFWATWCPPCRDEMPAMNSLYQKLKDQGFEMVAVNLGESRAAVNTFVNNYNLTFPVALDTRSLTGSLYGIRSIPTTYIINRRGLIVARLVGFIDWDTPDIITAFETLLAE